MAKIEIINHEKNRLRIRDSSETPVWEFRLGSADDKDHADPAIRNRRQVEAADLERLRKNKVFRQKEADGSITVYGA